jgi:hypothetical protein
LTLCTQAVHSGHRGSNPSLRDKGVLLHSAESGEYQWTNVSRFGMLIYETVKHVTIGIMHFDVPIVSGSNSISARQKRFIA